MDRKHTKVSAPRITVTTQAIVDTTVRRWLRTRPELKYSIAKRPGGFQLVFQNVGNGPITDFQDRELKAFAERLRFGSVLHYAEIDNGVYRRLRFILLRTALSVPT